MKLETYKRILSSIILTPITFFFVIKGSFLFYSFLLLCFLITLYEWHMMAKKKSYYIFGYFFLIFSFYTVYYVRSDLGENSLLIFLSITLLCIFTDLGGYIFGKIFKGPKLTKISPKKTYSGVFGSFFVSIIFSYFFINYSHMFTIRDIHFGYNEFFFVLLISIVSQIGDITVSYFKRLSKLKDTGKLIPGHGGILDRIDGMIFAFPFFYIFNFFMPL
tara:strand:- start:395 stop:1048 length:654 start_codon:yes stop_codon:yes gene_type:complete